MNSVLARVFGHTLGAFQIPIPDAAQSCTRQADLDPTLTIRKIPTNRSSARQESRYISRVWPALSGDSQTAYRWIRIGSAS